MEIETRPPETTPAAGHGKAAARGAGEDAAASPFLALLAALQPAAGTEAAPVAEAAAEEPAPQEPPLEAVPLAAQAAAAPSPLPPQGPAGAVAQAAGLDAMAAALRAPRGEPATPLREAVAAQPASAAPAAAAVLPTEQEAGSTALRKPRPLAAALQAATDGTQPDAAAETRTLQRQAHAEGLQAAAAQARSGAATGDTAALQAAAAPAEAWSGAGRLLHAAARGTERHAERGAQPPATVALGTGGVDVPVQGNGAAMAPTAPAEVVPAGAQAAATLVEKMRFWSTRGVQSASLELEAFDGAKVDVHIAVQGREAKVEFRSDLPEARRWLQDTLPQLEDMLQGEGLLLAGGFVGAGQQGQSDAQPRDAGTQPAARTGVVRVAVGDAQALREATAPRLPRGMGQTVDLFV